MMTGLRQVGFVPFQALPRFAATAGSARMPIITVDASTEEPIPAPDKAIVSIRFQDRTYDRTNRDKELLIQQVGYPRRWVDASKLQGLKVVDLCTGGGLFVHELKNEGVDIEGVDAILDEEQVKRPDLFKKADVRNLPYRDSSVDVLYCAMGVFSFGTHNQAMQVDTLREAKRVLKPGGKLRIGLDRMHPDNIKRLLPQVPGLEVTDEPDEMFTDDLNYIEITKK